MNAYIERDCTIHHNSKAFTSGGAIVTDDYIVAYPSKLNADGSRYLTDWHGNTLGTCTYWAKWRMYSRHGYPTDMVQIHARVNGKRYTGRGQGDGMICRLRLAKGQ